MSGSTDMAGLLIRLVCSLAVVVGLLMLLARLAGRRFQGRAGAPIQVIHKQPLSRGSSVAVVSVGTRVLVLGTTEHQVSLLTEVEPDEVGIDLTEPEPGLEPATGTGREGAEVLPLAGSILSAQTWRQALSAAQSKASQSRSRRIS